MENFNNANNQQKDFMSTWDWIITFILMSIPIVNIVLLFVWAFSGTKQSRKSLFKLYLILAIITVPLFFILILALILPAYASYEAKARFEEVKWTGDAIKKQVELCYFLEGDFANCNNNTEGNGYNLEPATNYATKYVDKAEIRNGVITVTATQNKGLKNSTYILTPKVNDANGMVTWSVDPSSTCFANNLCD